MKKRTRLVLICGLGVFVLLWAGRFVWELGAGTPIPLSTRQTMAWEPAGPASNVMVQQSLDYNQPYRSKANYASAKMVVTQANQSQTIEQKYERVASLSSLSQDFESDLDRIRRVVDEQKGVVQEEQSTGLAGFRSVDLKIGVIPDNFETAVAAFKTIGTIQSVSVTKTDRTADFLALEAKRVSLEKTRDGLKALRNPNADLADLMNLETRILEIEGQIQELGVSLGDFEETKSLCTLHLSLAERPQDAPGPDILAALLDSLAWAAWTWCGLAVAAMLLGVLILLAGILTEKILAWKERLEQRARD